MIRDRFAAVTFLILALTFAFAMPWPMRGQDNKNPYPAMAPLDQYLMDRDTEIALARSAAPESISRDAKILVLGRRGYETAVEGKNGFVCMAERAWTGPFDDPQFWNPKNRSAICFNPPAVRSAVPVTIHKDGTGIGWKIEGADPRVRKSRLRQKGAAAQDIGARRHGLHDVKKRVPY